MKAGPGYKSGFVCCMFQNAKKKHEQFPVRLTWTMYVKTSNDGAEWSRWLITLVLEWSQKIQDFDKKLITHGPS